MGLSGVQYSDGNKISRPFSYGTHVAELKTGLVRHSDPVLCATKCFWVLAGFFAGFLPSFYMLKVLICFLTTEKSDQQAWI